MSDALYRGAQRALQDRFGARKLADTVSEVIVHDVLSDDDKAFIGSRDFFFLSSVNEAGWPTVSYKGGAPGFVRVLDDATLAFPSYDGNGMFLSMGNIAASQRIGMLFIDFETPHRPRSGDSAPQRRRGTAGVVSGGTTGGHSAGPADLRQLPALHPPDEPRGGVQVRAGCPRRGADAGLEADRCDPGRSAGL